MITEHWLYSTAYTEKTDKYSCECIDNKTTTTCFAIKLIRDISEIIGLYEALAPVVHILLQFQVFYLDA